MWSIFCTIKRSWSQHFVEQFSSFVILTMSYTALLFVSLILTNTQSLFEMWGQVQQVSIYMKPGSSDEDRTQIESHLSSHSMVANIKEVSPDESAKKFEEKFANISSKKIDARQVAKFFPAYFVLELDQVLAYKTGVGALDQFIAEIQTQFPAIQSVSYGKSWLDRYIGMLSALNWVGGFLILAFLLAAVIISSSVVKTILYARRDEIEILEFIGADDKTIYLPQVINAFLLTFASFLMALGLNILGFYQIRSVPSSLLGDVTKSQLSFLSFEIVVSLMALALFSVIVYSILTIFNLLPRRKKALLLSEVIR